MEPYYDKDGTTIYNADCRDVLPLLPKVDLVLTDPPYGMSWQSNRTTVKKPKIYGDDALPVDIISELISMARGGVFCFCRWDNIRELPKPKSVIVWVKNQHSMGDLEHEYARKWEACCFWAGPEHEFKSRPADAIYAERTGNVFHPSEKPVKLIHALLEANYGDVILDPFMGSGTTLVAAQNLGRRAIGIEREKKYCDIAIKRLRQQPLF